MSSMASASLDALAQETWDDLVAHDPYTAATSGVTVERFPRGDLAEAEAAASTARDRLARLDAIDTAAFNATQLATVGFLRHWFENDILQPQRWATDFGVTPYTVSGLSMVLGPVFGSIDLSRNGEAERFAALAKDYVGAIMALRERTEAQAGNGWRLPGPAIPGARVAVEGVAQAARATLGLDGDDSAPATLRAQMQRLIEQQLEPAFAELSEALGPEYEAAAGEEVGMCHHPGGREAYRAAMRFHLSFDADPEAVHQIGLEEVQSLADQMRELRRDSFGFTGVEADFHQQLRSDPKAKVASAEELEAIFKAHLARMEPVFAKQFRSAPQARSTVRRLAPAMEAGMTFGYYEPPTRPGEEGVYHYSGNGIPDRLQMNAAPLIFHELVPGHHVAITRQAENERLPTIRRRTYAFSTFNEGWAEYSAGLADEAGLYENPYDQYGWLTHQRFVAQRLVVDTGLNHFGWSLDRARDYMSANTLESAAQVASETLRYGTDLPAQAMAYRMGFLKFREIRARAMDTLGDRFELPDFHEQVLEQGCLPIAVLEQSITDWAEGY